jgi:hypothetical protein
MDVVNKAGTLARMREDAGTLARMREDAGMRFYWQGSHYVRRLI